MCLSLYPTFLSLWTRRRFQDGGGDGVGEDGIAVRRRDVDEEEDETG